MVTVKGKLITFTGKHRKLLLENAKKAKLTPRQYLISAIDTRIRTVLFMDELDYQDGGGKTRGVPLGYEVTRHKAEGTN